MRNEGIPPRSAADGLVEHGRVAPGEGNGSIFLRQLPTPHRLSPAHRQRRNPNHPRPVAVRHLCSFPGRFHRICCRIELPPGRTEIPNLMAGGDAIGGRDLRADNFSFGLPVFLTREGHGCFGGGGRCCRVRSELSLTDASGHRWPHLFRKVIQMTYLKSLQLLLERVFASRRSASGIRETVAGMILATAMRIVPRIAAAGLCAISIEGATPAFAAATIQYWGGPVVAQVKVVPVFWSSHVNASVQADMQQFFSDAVNSPWYDVLMQYSTNSVSGGTKQTIVRGTAETGVVLVPSRCAGTTPCTVTDAQLQTELLAQIMAGKLPAPDNNTAYMVFIPPNVTVAGPDGTGDSGVNFCAYNSTTQTSGGQAFPYGLVMDTFTGSGATGCGSNTTALENETQLAAITLANIVTDPQNGFVGNTIAAPAAGYGTAAASPVYPQGVGQVGNGCSPFSNAPGTAGPGPTITVSGRTWVTN